MDRLTNIDKWKDTFFFNLPPSTKLVFIFIYENCNEAGFIDLNYEQMSSLLKLDKDKIALCIGQLESKIVRNASNTKIWIKKFLFHQKKIPINLKTDDGKHIRSLLEANLFEFQMEPLISTLIEESAKSKRGKAKITSAFVPPTIEEVINYFQNNKEWVHVPVNILKEAYFYYKGCGWIVGRKPMADWKASFSFYIKKKEIPLGYGKSPAETKLQVLIKENEKMSQIDFNQIAES